MWTTSARATLYNLIRLKQTSMRPSPTRRPFALLAPLLLLAAPLVAGPPVAAESGSPVVGIRTGGHAAAARATRVASSPVGKLEPVGRAIMVPVNGITGRRLLNPHGNPATVCPARTPPSASRRRPARAYMALLDGNRAHVSGAPSLACESNQSPPPKAAPTEEPKRTQAEPSKKPTRASKDDLDFYVD